MRKSFPAFLAVMFAVTVFSTVASAQYEPAGRQAPASTKTYEPKDFSGGPWSPTDSGANLTKDEPPMKPAAMAKYKSE